MADPKEMTYDVHRAWTDMLRSNNRRYWVAALEIETALSVIDQLRAELAESNELRHIAETERDDTTKLYALLEKTAINQAAVTEMVKAELATVLSERDAAVSMGTQLERERDAMESSLRNVLAMARRLKLKANRNVKTETPELDALIRFCAESGVVPTILRKEPPND